MLATFYISSIPNFILMAVPADLDPASLNTMIAFATGGLLGDVFLHLVPHAFFGEGDHGARSIVVDEKRNIVIGGAIFAGFAAFFVLDKTMRVLNAQAGNEGHSHSHHGHNHGPAKVEGSSTAISKTEGELRKRNVKGGEEIEVVVETEKEKEVNPSLKLSAYLNLFGDFTHNITDGLAMAASFYSSPQLGAVTTIATFCHEIPHEVSSHIATAADIRLQTTRF